LKEFAQLLGVIKGRLWKLAEFGDEIMDWNLLYRSGHVLLPEEYSAGEGRPSPQGLSSAALG
jgi:hypothetical protein